MTKRLILSMFCLASFGLPSLAAAADETVIAKPANPELEELRARIADQQEQIKKLQQAVDEQQKILERSLASAVPTTVAVAAGPADGAKLVPALGVNTQPNRWLYPAQVKKAASSNPCESESASPTFIRLGNTCIIPIGFMDLTSVWRDKNAGTSLGTNFGSVPFNTSVNAKNSEFRFTPQNSRLGLRVDGDWKGTHFTGYNEFDFLGTGAGTNYTVTNGAFVPRLRLFWVNVRKGKVEFLAGQSWSMLTPNRKGISALPGDLFYSQVIDVNYVAGLTWTRQPGVRVLFHPNQKVTMGVSFENPDQYIGGSAGGSSITLPTALAGLASTQLDNAPNIAGGTNTVLAEPTVHPDIIAKVAFDPSSRFHFEVAGLERTFKIYNPLAAPAPGAGQHFTKVGGGLLVGLNAEIIKGLRLVSTNYFSSGGGRYLFGQAPDVIVRSDGSLSNVHSSGTVDGFEATIKNTLLYAYYGGIYISRNATLDANGRTQVGYGYTGSPNSQNRAIQEFTFGFNQTMWKNPKYGAINVMGQYEYLTRSPWFVALNAPKATHDNTIYFNIRYTLPGSIPNF